MSNQGEDNWYPECEECGSGNIGEAYCKNCYGKLIKAHNKIVDELKLKLEQLRRKANEYNKEQTSEEIVKIIDPDNTFLKECEKAVKWKKKQIKGGEKDE